MENMCGIKMFSAQDICKGLHVTKYELNFSWQNIIKK